MELRPPGAGTNRFDTVATTWDDNPVRVAQARAVGAAIAEQAGLSSEHHVLDYGCGTGLLTWEVRPHVASVTGADTSDGMLAVLRQKIAAEGATNARTQRLSPADGFAVEGVYDRIVSSMTMHHVPDVPGLLRRLHQHLAPGGRIAIADLDQEDGTFHKPDITDVYHLGFDRRIFLGWLSEAGFTNGSATTAFVHQRDGRAYPVFLAVADA